MQDRLALATRPWAASAQKPRVWTNTSTGSASRSSAVGRFEGGSAGVVSSESSSSTTRRLDPWALRGASSSPESSEEDSERADAH